MLILLGVWNGVAAAGTKSTTVSVASGDTLWKIAHEVDPGSDPRVISNEIIQLNHLSGTAHIYPGEVLKVPVQ